MGIPLLGPDLSFFKELEAQQAARTEQVMSAWNNERERRVALSLGQCLQKQYGWKNPHFIPADQTMAVVSGPDPWTFLEMDLTYIFQEFEEQLGQRMRAGFWEVVIDWDDKDGCFGELVCKITAELTATPASYANDGGASA